jgi:hypothetical protein
VAVKEAEILVNGAVRLLQFEGVSGWIKRGGANAFLFRLVGGGGP